MISARYLCIVLIQGPAYACREQVCVDGDGVTLGAINLVYVMPQCARHKALQYSSPPITHLSNACHAQKWLQLARP
jgi:hypothetical protein